MPPEVPEFGPGDALLLVDVQNDFLSSGSLAVPDGDAILPVLNRTIRIFQEKKLPVFASRDWHPEHHCSFREQGGPWPPHCVQGTRGAAFAPSLELPDSAVIISKGERVDRDAYSAFEGTDLDRRLTLQKIKNLVVGGLATDYCVFNTVKDARRLGYGVWLLERGIRAVNVKPDDGTRAKGTMKELGVRLLGD